MSNVISNLFVDQFKMYENIENQKGSYLSHSVLFYLMDRGISRNKAYEITQELAKDNNNLIETLHHLSEFISPKELEGLLDLSRFHKSVDEIFNRVLDQ
jgi:adenylosuccinate lyase